MRGSDGDTGVELDFQLHLLFFVQQQLQQHLHLQLQLQLQLHLHLHLQLHLHQLYPSSDFDPCIDKSHSALLQLWIKSVVIVTLPVAFVSQQQQQETKLNLNLNLNLNNITSKGISNYRQHAHNDDQSTTTYIPNTLC
jgi:hypothetical protein